VESGVADIGADLRQARVARQQSIEDISKATKITATQIRALENDQFDKLPGGLFTRAFLRTYAREVGLDPEDLVARYRAAFEPAEPPSDAPAEGEPPPAVRSAPAVFDDSLRSRQIQILQLCIILLLVALYFAVTRRPAPQEPTEAASQVTTSIPTPVAAAKPETPVATKGTTPSNGPLILELKPTGPCWVAAVVDGQPAFRRLLAAGETETLTIREGATLRIGDPSALAYTIDGVAGKPFGAAGQAVTVQIGRANYKNFLP
jgi:transcriptional regulator with XRE-family HTH domain